MPGFRRKCILPISLICLFLFAACSSVSSGNKIPGVLTIKNSDLKKKVGIALFENQTSFKDRSFEKIFQQYIIESMTDSCSDILLVKPGTGGYPDFLVKLPMNETGSIDNMDLAQLGRQAGMNAIVTGEIIGISWKEEKRGILFFKGLHQIIDLQIKIEVYDMGTGVKLIDQRYIEEIEIDEMELALFKNKEIVSISEIEDVFLEISEDIAEKICQEVNLPPWQGYITSVTENNIMISSGKKVGLVPGVVLEVFTTGELIEGVDGHRFCTPGHKTGEVKLTEVYADSCKAVLSAGSDITEGSSVRIKK